MVETSGPDFTLVDIKRVSVFTSTGSKGCGKGETRGAEGMTTSAVGAGNETGTETGTDGNTIDGVDSVDGDGSGNKDGGDESGGGDGLDGGDGTDGVETETCAHSRAT